MWKWQWFPKGWIGLPAGHWPTSFLKMDLFSSRCLYHNEGHQLRDHPHPRPYSVVQKRPFHSHCTNLPGIFSSCCCCQRTSRTNSLPSVTLIWPFVGSYYCCRRYYYNILNYSCSRYYYNILNYCCSRYYCCRRYYYNILNYSCSRYYYSNNIQNYMSKEMCFFSVLI